MTFGRGDGEKERWGDWETGRKGDGETWRWGGLEMGRKIDEQALQAL